MPSLGNDLALIRKEQNLSLADIQKATKIPKHVINSIEDDSIFSDFEENITYIRSYVRSYAKALSIDEKQIIHALDKQEKNNYSGSLQKILKAKKRSSEYDEEDTGQETDKQEESKSEDEMVHDHSPEFAQDINTADSSQPAGPSQPVTKSPGIETIDWANMGRKFQPLESTKSRIWIGMLAIVFVATGGLFFYLYYFNSGSIAANQSTAGNQQTSQTTAASDSLQLSIVPSVDEDTSVSAENTETATLQNRNLEALSDTLTLVIYAAHGKLEPVRVYTDIMDSINPYWIEASEAVRFNFVNSIRIRGQFSRMILFMNGHIVNNFREQFYNPDTRLLEISRSFFVDNPKWLRQAPDSLGIDAPPPSVIRERPTFN